MTNLPEIGGNFDGFGDGTHFYGWVSFQEQDATGDIYVFVTYNGVEIGRSLANLARGDGYRGFHVTTKTSVTKEDVIKSTVIVWASAGNEPVRLYVYPKMRDELIESSITDLLLTIPDVKDRQRIISAALPQSGGPFIPTTTVTIPNNAPRSSDEISCLGFCAGTTSADNSAIVGRNGNLFIYRANNDIFSLYQMERTSAAVTELADRWNALIEKRRDEIQQSPSTTFIQLIIPDKSSVYPDLFPIQISYPSSILAVLEPLCNLQEYLSVVDIFSKSDFSEPYYLKSDSHLSDRGSFWLLRQLLTSLADRGGRLAELVAPGLNEMDTYRSFDSTRIVTGDLGPRFFGVPLYETVPTISNAFSHKYLNSVALITEDNAQNAHNGMKMVWKNPSAPIEIKVVAFANSFFERGAAPSGLSWWCKTLFSEFHFIWSPELDMEYVNNVRPDLVICQTVERFLRIVPDR